MAKAPQPCAGLTFPPIEASFQKGKCLPLTQ